MELLVIADALRRSSAVPGPSALVSDGSRLGIVGRFRSIGGAYVSSLMALDLRTSAGAD